LKQSSSESALSPEFLWVVYSLAANSTPQSTKETRRVIFLDKLFLENNNRHLKIWLRNSQYLTYVETAGHDASSHCCRRPRQATSPSLLRYQECLSSQVDFPFSPNLPPPKVVTIINLIIRNWSNELSKAEFYDANNKKIGIIDLPTDKPSFDETFSLTTAEKQNRHIYALVKIRCFDKLFSILKRSIWNLLIKHNVFLCQHFLGFKQIEVSSPGWILQANPSFHSSDGIGDEIREFGKNTLHKLFRKDIDDLANEFPKFYDSDT
jgi:hypothetical protein